MVNWMIQPVDYNLKRSFDPVRWWTQLIVAERHNVSGSSGMTAGSWQVTGIPEGMAGLVPGNRVQLSRDGDLIMTGPVTDWVINNDETTGITTWTVGGLDDSDRANGRILYPDPTKVITAQPVAYDNRTGPAETVILGYLNAELGPDALASRRVADLRMPTDLGRGSTVTITGRLEQLGVTIADIAESAGLHVGLVQHEDADGTPFIEVKIREIDDVSANVRFGTASDGTPLTVQPGWSYSLSRPAVTHAIVAGQGQGVNRVFVEAIDADAEELWHEKIELLIDRRDINSDGTEDDSGTVDLTELQAAATDALSDGANPAQATFTVADSVDAKYRTDWRVGDIVGVSLLGNDLTAPVREVTTTVEVTDGQPTETIAAVVGSRDSTAWATQANKAAAKALQQINRLQTI